MKHPDLYMKIIFQTPPQPKGVILFEMFSLEITWNIEIYKENYNSLIFWLEIPWNI